MSRTKIVATLILASASNRLNLGEYTKDYLAYKAVQVADAIVKKFNGSDEVQVAAAAIIGAQYSYQLPNFTPNMIADALANAEKWLFEVDAAAERFIADVKEAEKKAKAEADAIEAARLAEEEEILRKAEQIAAKAAARKQSEEVPEPEVIKAPEPVPSPPAPEPVPVPADPAPIVPEPEVKKTPEAIAVVDLAIPKKQKAELIAAGLNTGADILKYDAEWAAEKGIERLKEIGPAAREQILNLLK